MNGLNNSEFRIQNSEFSRHGFTLVEMLVVVAIILLLISITIPAIWRARESAKDGATRQLMATLSTALEQYATEQSGMYPPDRMYYGSKTLRHGEALAQGLTGYLTGDLDGAGTSLSDPSEFGFRLMTGGNGKVFGPYGPVDSRTLRQYETDATIRAYIDVRGQTNDPKALWTQWAGRGIQYFRAVPVVMNGVSRTIDASKGGGSICIEHLSVGPGCEFYRGVCI